MHVNPYESPQSVQAGQRPVANPLKGPAIAALIVSVLAIGGAVIGLVCSVILLMMMADLDLPQNGGDFVEGILTSAFWLTFGLAGIAVWASMRRRRRRWLIIAWSLVAICSLLLAPLGAIVLIRLRRKDVWDSFSQVGLQ
jgi:hypothetical protein